MSRYRPPPARSSPYITRAGHTLMQQELTHLWKVKRPEVTRKVSEAAAQGDRSENAEYIYGKRQLREIDARIQFLSKRLDELEVIERAPATTDRVYFGACVTVEDVAGQIQILRIVGADEVGRESGFISIDAPLARALIGKQVGDEVTITEQQATRAPRVLEVGRAARDFSYTITQINYP